MCSVRIVKLRVTVKTKMLLWRTNVASNNKTYLSMSRARYFCPVVTEFGVSRQICIKVPNIKCHGNPSSGSHADTWPDRRTDMARLIGASCDYANSLKIKFVLSYTLRPDLFAQKQVSDEVYRNGCKDDGNCLLLSACGLQRFYPMLLVIPIRSASRFYLTSRLLYYYYGML
jgi:hypothetical protein